MPKRRDRATRPRKGKRKDRPPKPKIYNRPYHVDRAKSLGQLEGWAATSEIREGAGLVDRCNAAVSRPVGLLSVRELEMLFNQKLGDLHWLMPIAMEYLQGDICAHFGSGLLRSVMQAKAAFWEQHPYALAELVELIDARSERLATSFDRHLADDARSFADQHRT